jgi:hypothetical protein
MGTAIATGQQSHSPASQIEPYRYNFERKLTDGATVILCTTIAVHFKPSDLGRKNNMNPTMEV